MAARLKEQEKNEKLIRSLTKLPENRRCINCGSLGPQYVCTNFSIFICTTCSGIHREFTHRVKSISMATFTPVEVSSLQSGGNQRAREIYFKEWDSSRQSLPDPSNPEKLRDFIKAVYVDKRFSGDRRGRLSDAEDRLKYGQSPSYEERDDRRYGNRPVSRGSDRGFDERMSPGRFEDKYDRGYDRDKDRRFDDRDRRFDDRGRYEERDRHYDDRRDGDRGGRYEDKDRHYDDRRDGDRGGRYEDKDRHYDDRRDGDRGGRYEDRERHYDDRRSDDRDRSEEQRRWDDRGAPRRTSDDMDRRPSRTSNYRGGETPPIRSVRDILGEDVPKLQVEDRTRSNPRTEDGESPHSVSSQQSEGRLRSFKSIETNGVAKAATPVLTESLIDFSVDPEPPKVGNATVSTAVNPTATFDPFGSTVETTSKPFDAFSTVEPPTSAPVDPFAPKANTSAPFDPFTSEPSLVNSSNAGWASFDLSPPKVSTAAPTPGQNIFQQQQPASVPNGWPPQPAQSSKENGWPVSQPAQVLNENGWPPSQPAQSLQEPWTNTPGAASQQQRPWNSLNVPGSMSGFVQQQQQHQQQQVVGVPSQAPSAASLQQQNTETSQRREIPGDLFYAPPLPVFNPVMQMRPGFMFPPVQYGAVMPGAMPYVQQPPKSKSNPFDVAGDSTPSFPSMAHLQSALPALGSGPLSTPAPAMGAPHSHWPQPGGIPPSLPPASFPPPSYAQPGLQGVGFNQQHGQPHTMPQFPQGGPNAGYANPGQFMNGPLSFPSLQQNTIQPAGGNPFG